MAALFSPRANLKARVTLIVALGLFAGAPLALMAWVRTPAATRQHAVVAQPVSFDHRLHAGGLGLDCRYCHTGVERSAVAGVPPTAACVGCHRPSLMQTGVFAPVRESQRTQKPIAWSRVNALPDFVFFDHSIHVAKGFGCAACHGRVEQMARVEQVTPMTMGWCMSCHRDPGPGLRRLTSCTTCHR